MNQILISALLLGANAFIFIYALSTTISLPLTLILLVMAFILTINIYNVGTRYIKLEQHARKNKAVIAAQKKEIAANQEKLKKILDDMTEKDREKIDEEAIKLYTETGKRKERFKEEYWTKLGRASAEAGSKAEGKISELNTKREEINGLIELSRKKYMKRQLDEESFKDIVRDYQKELIGIEGEIKKLGTSETKNRPQD